MLTNFLIVPTDHNNSNHHDESVEMGKGVEVERINPIRKKGKLHLITLIFSHFPQCPPLPRQTIDLKNLSSN